MLHHVSVVASGSSPTQSILFCHGILGSGGNFRTLAKQFVEARPSYAAVLVDLRRHGQSLHETGPGEEPPVETVAACAEDLVRLAAALPLPVTAIVGHSFGGKVALAYAALSSASTTTLRDLFVLDSTPGARPLKHGSESTLDVLDALEKAPKLVPSREAFVADLRALGTSEMLARWLAMNLVRVADQTEEQYRFRLDLAAIRRLLDDYFHRDLWSVVEHPPAGLAVHLVIGGRSSVFDAHDRERAERAVVDHPDQVDLVTLPEAGHWIHVDDPQGVLNALLR